MDDFSHAEAKEPRMVLPDDYSGLNIALRMSGGVGDVIVSICGTAAALAKKHSCRVTAFVRDSQIDLAKHFYGITEVKRAQALNDPGVRSKFDVLLDFYGVFNTARQLKAQDYYTLVSERAGIDVPPGELIFDGPVGDKGTTIAIHPGSSNSNRRWPENRWKTLAYTLSEQSYTVYFLGTKDEAGFTNTSKKIVKISDFDESLEGQVALLRRVGYFIGNDSGFAHIAGVLKIPGLVLFSASHPKDVIARYKTLRGIHAFEKLGIEPTRSLRQDDPLSLKALHAIQVKDVLEAMGLSADVCTTHFDGETVNQAQIAVIGDSLQASDLSRDLSEYYVTDFLSEMPCDEDAGLYDAILIPEVGGQCQIQTRQVRVRVRYTSTEDIIRCLRESLTRGEG